MASYTAASRGTHLKGGHVSGTRSICGHCLPAVPWALSVSRALCVGRGWGAVMEAWTGWVCISRGAFCFPALWEALFIRTLNWPRFPNKLFEVFCAWLID